MYDCECNLLQQVSNICKTDFYHVRNRAAIKQSPDLKTAKIAPAALTTSTLDCCNALLNGLPKNRIHKIKLVQNSATSVVMGLKNRTILHKQGKIYTGYLLRKYFRE